MNARLSRLGLTHLERVQFAGLIEKGNIHTYMIDLLSDEDLRGAIRVAISDARNFNAPEILVPEFRHRSYHVTRDTLRRRRRGHLCSGDMGNKQA